MRPQSSQLAAWATENVTIMGNIRKCVDMEADAGLPGGATANTNTSIN